MAALADDVVPSEAPVTPAETPAPPVAEPTKPTILLTPVVVPAAPRPPPPVLQFVAGPDTQPTAWTVLDETGRRMGTERFARTVGDNETLAHLDLERDLSRIAGISLGSAGGALLTASFFALVTEVGKPDADDYYVSVLDYENYEDYDQARARAENNYDDARDRYRDEKLWAAAFLGASGVLAVSVAPFATREWRARHNDPSLVYTPERARGLVEKHNQPATLITPIVTPTGVGVTGSF